jgi:hypothetical protein
VVELRFWEVHNLLDSDGCLFKFHLDFIQNRKHTSAEYLLVTRRCIWK